MYFAKFPDVYHAYEGKDGRDVIVRLKDITRNIRIRKEVLSNITMYEEYAIQEGETPEDVSERYYGTPQYHWVVMLVNERYDYASEWPLPTSDLIKYVEAKYGDPYGVHHYEDSNGFVVSASVSGSSAVTNFTHEERINESKRQIKMISQGMLSLLLENFEKIMSV